MPYLIFHKPYGVLCQFTEEGIPRPTLKHYIPIPDVYPVGRLDHDSEGLVFLTDDGPLNARLIDPRFGHERTYWVQVEGIPTPEALRALSKGVMIQGKKTLPALAWVLPEAPDLPPRDPPIRVRRHIPTTWLAITLREGRNRQVRRMTAAVGIPTLRLIRQQIGPLQLAELPLGEWRHLSPVEVKQLRQYCFSTEGR
ncbi:MAG: pseudouridine synthase [Cyanobacteriota bacterium]|nr:pseudouridine synthase [Cyanobacteriota bacterium]